ncbi:MAG TPA: glycosyltransferase [Actinomycetospora sp.]|uniref:glycosyltransferase n=1 Tax=Actinomycetospora sp. TaxID=1872135 RepID=UPI002F40AEA9
MDGDPTGSGLAVLVVSAGAAEPLERTLDSVAKHLPAARVLVWCQPVATADDRTGLPATRPEVDWTVAEADAGRVAARNALAARADAASGTSTDVLLLEPGAELLGPLAAARAVLARPGVAAVAPVPESGPTEDHPWDAVARRTPSLVRDLADYAGAGERLRGRTAGGLLAAPPAGAVDGVLVGGCLLVSGAARAALGDFDEDFFDRGEDLAWQRAARAAGWTLQLVTDPDDDGRGAGQVRLPAAGVAPASAGVVSDTDAARREAELERAARVILLGNAGHRGAGTVYAAGTRVLDRLRPTARAARRRRTERVAERAAGRPGVVITSNNLVLGGAERQRIMLANELVARGHPVTVVCLKELGRYVTELDPRVRLTLQPFWQPVVDAADLPGDDAVVVGGVTNTEMGFAVAWRAAGRARGQRRRWLPATHDPAQLDRATYSAKQARALRAADGLVVLSRQHHVDLTRHQRLTDLAMVVPNGIPEPPALPYRATAGRVRFGMLTRIQAYKNPLLLADALGALDARGLTDWSLDIFGDGPDRVALEARTPAHLADRVRWRGRSSGPDHAFAEIDVLCVPSGFEAFPLVMVEAMARGVPVMAAVSGAIPEMLDDGRAGVIVDPLTREAWTDALEAVVRDPEGTARLGAAGRERALANYTATAMTDQYQRAFAHVLGRAIPGAPDGPPRVLQG